MRTNHDQTRSFFRFKFLLFYFEKVKESKNLFPYLRQYAFVNEHEFFAVCVEHFFETPSTFLKEMPDVYQILTNLLNQNPLNINQDYKLMDALEGIKNFHRNK